jgi:DNA (cytosine-5)-methyltransferase 1
MSRRPRCLDLCAGAGGSATGYARAGFEVTCVDVKRWRCFPHDRFELIQADLVELGVAGIVELAERTGADLITASPPCKTHTDMAHFASSGHVDLVPLVREALAATGLPSIIENVPGCPLVNPVQLCGSNARFDLGVQRERLFEAGGGITLVGAECDHQRQAERAPLLPGYTERGWPIRRYHRLNGDQPYRIVMSPVIGVYGGGQGLGPGETKLWARAMGIDWMSRRAMAEAIPPAYTEYLGRQVLEQIGASQ